MSQHLTHELKQVQYLGLLDFDQLKGLVSEEDLEANVAEWSKKGGKKWYHMTIDAFVKLMYEVRGSAYMFGNRSFWLLFFTPFVV